MCVDFVFYFLFYLVQMYPAFGDVDISDLGPVIYDGLRLCSFPMFDCTWNGFPMFPMHSVTFLLIYLGAQSVCRPPDLMMYMSMEVYRRAVG